MPIQESTEVALTRARLAGAAPLPAALEAQLEALARQHMGFTTLERRKSDSLDFRDVACWCAREALLAAYMAGFADGRRAPGDAQ